MTIHTTMDLVTSEMNIRIRQEELLGIPYISLALGEVGRGPVLAVYLSHEQALQLAEKLEAAAQKAEVLAAYLNG